jgi:hypothetical protein
MKSSQTIPSWHDPTPFVACYGIQLRSCTCALHQLKLDFICSSLGEKRASGTKRASLPKIRTLPSCAFLSTKKLAASSFNINEYGERNCSFKNRTRRALRVHHSPWHIESSFDGNESIITAELLDYPENLLEILDRHLALSS